MIISSTCCGVIIAIPEKTYFSIINRYTADAYGLKIGTGDWGLGIGDWGLGTGNSYFLILLLMTMLPSCFPSPKYIDNINVKKLLCSILRKKVQAQRLIFTETLGTIHKPLPFSSRSWAILLDICFGSLLLASHTVEAWGL
ncbi:MAG TPA: hypothetical protein DEF48_27115 [Nostoc sp. UBA8866]|nr:hypothetical protein [Nostoc sp. UBA8866]